ncbi:hypothetical protein EDEG_03064 [Edhazardia aedis USNM 41457]|uniref:Uncharacterized protein n=1 Tax=Edhazardia aedis (strain USNM 41457) TaxID=1003232 RepID=J9DIT8_EDHAE|nr:hypothetical protein EDEG_03064 [Edhazardia aedis USNM 41457]|eukprot:EJW02525.1 hypothetical protein EDEG_03064 [Edhazardia aedis USNM 41457]
MKNNKSKNVNIQKNSDQNDTELIKNRLEGILTEENNKKNKIQQLEKMEMVEKYNEARKIFVKTRIHLLKCVIYIYTLYFINCFGFIVLTRKAEIVQNSQSLQFTQLMSILSSIIFTVTICVINYNEIKHVKNGPGSLKRMIYGSIYISLPLCFILLCIYLPRCTKILI